MVAGHRWEREFDWLGYRCVPLPIGGVESHQWCVGCGCRIDDKELHDSQLPINNECFLHVSLDMMARLKGYEPIEAGTYAALRLNKGRSRQTIACDALE